MSDENLEDIDLEENDEVVEELDLALDEVETHEDSEEDTTDWKAEALKQKAINARLAKKVSKPQQAPVLEQTQSTNKNIDSDTVDEKILKSTKGYDEETMEKLKVVAKGLDTDLFKAEADPLFQDYLARKQADERKEKAKLGSSKGSQVSQERSIADLTDEEHKALVLETMSKVN